MRSKCTIFIAILFSFLVFFGCSKGEKAEGPEGWRGKVDYEEGVKTVKNPDEPLYGEAQFVLEEDLSIGREDDENYLFYRALDIAVDSLDNIYVLELGNCRIQKFDKNGNYLLTIGKKGQGPVEFERPITVLLDDETGDIYVRDGVKVKIFDQTGNHQRDILLKYIPFDLFIDVDRKIWGKFSINTDTGRVMSFIKFNEKGDVLKNIAAFPYKLTFARLKSAVVALSHGFIYDISISKIDDDTYIYGYSKEYALNVIDRNAGLLFKIQKEESYHPITEREKNEIRRRFKRFPENLKKAIQFPETRPFFGSLFSDDKGRIYVHRLKSPLDEEKGIIFDIFSKNGFYLYRTNLPHWPQVIGKGLLYAIVSSEEKGGERIKRFKIMNWEEIKDGIS